MKFILCLFSVVLMGVAFLSAPLEVKADTETQESDCTLVTNDNGVGEGPLQELNWPGLAKMKVCRNRWTGVLPTTAGTAKIYRMSGTNLSSSGNVVFRWQPQYWHCDMHSMVRADKTISCAGLNAKKTVQDNVFTVPVAPGNTTVFSSPAEYSLALQTSTRLEGLSGTTGYCGSAQFDLYDVMANSVQPEGGLGVFWSYSDSGRGCPATVTTTTTATNCSATTPDQTINATWGSLYGAQSYLVTRHELNASGSPSGVSSSVTNNGNSSTSASFTGSSQTKSYAVYVIGYTGNNATGSESDEGISNVTNASCSTTGGPQTLTVSCSGVVSGQNITWTADPQGGPSTSYTYSWTGDESLSGTTNPLSKTYTGTGSKSATVTVTSGTGTTAQTATGTCNATIAPVDSSNCTPDMYNLRVIALLDDGQGELENGTTGGTSKPKLGQDLTVTATPNRSCLAGSAVVPSSTIFADFNPKLAAKKGSNFLGWTINALLPNYQLTRMMHLECTAACDANSNRTFGTTLPYYFTVANIGQTAGELVAHNIFLGFKPVGTISGHVFLDANYNKQKDQTEGGFVGGATVKLMLGGGSSQERASTTTDGAGNYKFTLDATQMGISYDVQVIPPAGYGVTTGNSQQSLPISQPNLNNLVVTAASVGVGALPGAFSITSTTSSCVGSQSVITVAWSPSANVESYDLFIYKNDAFDSVVRLSKTAISYIVNTTGGSSYTFTMSAYNAAGSSFTSRTAPVTALYCAPDMTLQVKQGNATSIDPYGSSKTISSGSQVTLKWKISGDAVSCTRTRIDALSPIDAITRVAPTNATTEIWSTTTADTANITKNTDYPVTFSITIPPPSNQLNTFTIKCKNAAGAESTEQSVAVTVTPPPFDYSLSTPSNIRMLQGQIDTSQVALAIKTSGVSQEVRLFASRSLSPILNPISPPTFAFRDGATGPVSSSCSPNPNCIRTLQVQTLSDTTLGDYKYFIGGASNGLTDKSSGEFTVTVDALPTTITNTPTSITSTTATLNGTATVPTGASAILEHGFLYAASVTAPTTGCTVNTPAPCTKVTKTGVPTGPNGSFTDPLTNLTAGTTYQVKAYAKNTVGESTNTDWKQFITDTLPTAVTNVPTSITSTTATLNGIATIPTGASAISEHGFLYAASATTPATGCTVNTPAPCTKVTKTGVPTGPNGSFTDPLTNLTAGTTYQVKAYAKNSAGESTNTDWKSFTTDSLPAVTTGNIVNGTFNGTATVSTGASAITVRGFVYKESTITTDCTAGSTAAGCNTTSIVTLGVNNAFSATPALTAGKVYSARAYAINSAGTNYGAWTPTVTLSANQTTITTGESVILTWVTSNSPTRCDASIDWTGSKNITGGSETVTLTNTGTTAITKRFDIFCQNTATGLASETARITITVNPSAPVVTLTASPATVATGASTTLTWNVTGSATSCTRTSNLASTLTAGSSWNVTGDATQITNGTNYTQVVTLQNSASPVANQTNTFTIQCTNAGGSSAAVPVTVTVLPLTTPAVSTTLACIPLGYSGNGFTISWPETGVTYVDIDTNPDASGNFTEPYYHKSVTGLTSTLANGFGAFGTGSTGLPDLTFNPGTDYHIRTFDGTGHSATKSYRTPLACPVVDIEFDRVTNVDSPVLGSTFTVAHNTTHWLSWDSRNADSCTLIGPGILPVVPLSNTYLSLGALQGPDIQTYTLTCTGAGVRASDFVQVTVNPPQLFPWIQTTGGDVHSNKGIDTPGGP